jgi:DNA-binding MarR family transcriptional regulator
MSSISKKNYETQAAFRYAIRRFLRTSEKNARSAGITPQQYQLLLSIKGVKGRDFANVSEIAEALQISHHAAVGLCTRAEQSGLIYRSVHMEDRRHVCIRLTEKGEKFLSTIAKANRLELDELKQSILDLFFNLSTNLSVLIVGLVANFNELPESLIFIG